MTTDTAIPSRPTVRAVVVHDPSPASNVLVSILSHDADIVIVEQPASAERAVTAVVRWHPDVVIFDLQLPGGGIQQAIEQIMARTPTPILILAANRPDPPGSSHAAFSSETALLAGALETITVPAHWTTEDGVRLRRRVHQLSRVHVIRHPRGKFSKSTDQIAPDVHRALPGRRAVVAIAASTGGPSALATVVAGLKGVTAPILVVQHLHPDFTDGLVEWLARVSPLPVGLAEHGMLAQPGHIYVAPGGHHLRHHGDDTLELALAPVTAHRPSADELFLSVAESSGAAGVGVLLTGMGEDGARGLLAMHHRGACTLAQDEASSAVFGMPRAAQRLGAVDHILALDEIAIGIRRAVSGART